LKPLYFLALGLAVPAGLVLVWIASAQPPFARFAIAMSPAVVVVLASLFDRPVPRS
jgi:hypothetical protein